MRNWFFAIAAMAFLGALAAGTASLMVSRQTARGQRLLSLEPPREPDGLLLRVDLGVALGRTPDGLIYVLDPVCPYLGCRLEWQPREGAFLCPCHGAHFSRDGSRLAGPAPAHLRRFGIRRSSGKILVDRSIRLEMVGHEISPDRQYPGSLIPADSE